MKTNIGWKDSVNPTKIKWMDEFVIGNKVLDLGAGRGWYSQYLAEKGYSVTAIDQTPLFHDSRVTIIKRTLEDILPFEDETFDTVLAWDIIEHVKEEAQLLSEIKRVLKKGGRLILSAPHADDSRIAKSYLTYCHYKDKTHHREYLPLELKSKIESFGMSSLKLELTGGNSYPYVLLCFIDNYLFRLLTIVYIKILFSCKIIQIKNCHGDIFGVFVS